MKHCLHCAEPIHGRSDKKFCDDQCRNAYNNELRRDTTNTMRNVNNLLKKNYRILAELEPAQKRLINLAELHKKGFNFSYFTSRYETKQGKVYQYVYDLGYMLYDQQRVMIVQKQDWVEERMVG